MLGRISLNFVFTIPSQKLLCLFVRLSHFQSDSDDDSVGLKFYKKEEVVLFEEQFISLI